MLNLILAPGQRFIKLINGRSRRNKHKKSNIDIDIYYIDCENIHSVNPLYLIIHSATGHFKEKTGEKYLIIDSTEKYEEVFSGIRSEIKTLNGGKELFYEKNYVRIGVDTDDDLTLNKPLKFPTPTIIIRCVFKGVKNCIHKFI